MWCDFPSECRFPKSVGMWYSDSAMRSKPNRRKLRDTAIRAARAAGKILKKSFAKEIRIDFKGEVNLVTEADRAAEAAVIRILRRQFPDHRFLAEEGGAQDAAGSIGSVHKWIIDPLDGTTNFAHSNPTFCVSIGLESRGQIVLGVVYDPLREETFLAEKGQGATLNGIPIRVSKTEKLNGSLLVTGFAYDVREDLTNNLDHFANFSLRAQGMRRTGSAALDLCYVASGRFDGFWEMKLSPWDTAAAYLIATESGATVTDFRGRPYNIYLKEILATNGKIHSEMIEILGLSKRKEP
jgi:myo-inositol-1(or 4)-monophosphatase